MQENFAKVLRDLNRVATKEEPSVSEVYENIGEGMERPEQVYNVFKFQREKRLIMDELHRKLKAIDEGEGATGFTEGDEHLINNWDIKSNRGACNLLSGEISPITAGEIFSDGSWAISYKLDASLPHSIKKHFVIAEAKRRMMKSLNDQIRHKKGVMNKNGVDLKYDPRKDIQPRTAGIVAERLVRTFFEQVIIDLDLPLIIEEVDTWEDNEHKIDFLIETPDYIRGIDVDKGYKKDYGIQLTISIRKDVLREKGEQIEEQKQKKIKSSLHIDDIILVRLPLNNCTKLYHEWSHSGKHPGGPTKLWGFPEKEIVFRGVLKDIVPEDKINEMWNKVKNSK